MTVLVLKTGPVTNLFMPATNLSQYYQGMGQALPSVSSMAGVYSKYGLGDPSTYTGTAGQNTALLGKLQGGGYSQTPVSQSPGGGGGSGGYAQTPAGQPQSISNDPGLNDLTSFTQNNASQRQALVDKLNGELSGAYDTAANQSGLTAAQASVKNLTDQQSAAHVAAANAPLQEINSSRGTFATAGQIAGQTGTDLMPINNQLSLLASALPGASQAQANAQNATNTRLGLIQDAQSRQLTGFDTNAQNQLAAIQAKVSRGQKLTDEEFERETQLSVAQKSYQAAVDSAKATAAGATGAAGINSEAGLNAAALGKGFSSYKALQDAYTKGGGNIVSQEVNAAGYNPGTTPNPAPTTSGYGWQQDAPLTVTPNNYNTPSISVRK